MENIKVDIVIPVYNEEYILEKSIEILRDYLIKNFKYDWSIIIVDNASIDRTLEKASKLSKKYSDVKVIYLDKKGRGGALRRAWLESDADILSYMDVDLSTKLDAFPKLIDAIANEGYDIATGSRLIKGSKTRRSLKREVLSRGYNLIVKLFLSTKFSDAQCGFKAISKKVAREIISKIKDNVWFFDTELLVLAEKKGFKIKDIPVEWLEDEDSRVQLYDTMHTYIRSLWHLRKRIKSEF